MNSTSSPGTPWCVAPRLIPDKAATAWHRIAYATPRGDLRIGEWIASAPPEAAARLTHILESEHIGDERLVYLVHNKRWTVRTETGWAAGDDARPIRGPLARHIRARMDRDPAYRRAYEDAILRFRIARALIRIRDAARLSQVEVCRLTGTSRVALSQAECGYVLPTLPHLAATVRACGYATEVRFTKDGAVCDGIPVLMLNTTSVPAAAREVRAWTTVLMRALQHRLALHTVWGAMLRFADRLGMKTARVYRLLDGRETVTLPTVADLASTIHAHAELRFLTPTGRPSRLVPAIPLTPRAGGAR